MKVPSAFYALSFLVFMPGHAFSLTHNNQGNQSTSAEATASNRACLTPTVSSGFAVDTDGGDNANGSATYQNRQSYMGNWGGNIDPSKVLGAVNLDGRNGLHGGDIICYENLGNQKSVCAVVFDNGYAQAGQSALGSKPAEATAPVHYALGAYRASGSGSALGSAKIKSHPVKLGEGSRREINNLLTQARATGNYRFVNQRVQEIAQQFNCASLNLELLPADQYQAQIRKDAFSFESNRSNYVSPAPISESRSGISPIHQGVSATDKPAASEGLRSVSSGAAKKIVDQATRKITELDQRIKTLEADSAGINARVSDLKQKADSLNEVEQSADKAAIQAEIQGLERNLSEKRSETESLKKTKTEITAEANQTSQEIDQLSRQLESQNNKIEGIKGQREKLLSSLRELDVEFAAVREDSERENIKNKLSKLRGEIAIIEQNLTKEQERSQKLTAEITSKSNASLRTLAGK